MGAATEQKHIRESRYWALIHHHHPESKQDPKEFVYRKCQESYGVSFLAKQLIMNIRQPFWPVEETNSWKNTLFA